MEKFDPIDIFFIALISGYFLTLACFVMSLIYTIIRNHLRRNRKDIVKTKSKKRTKESQKIQDVGVSTNPIYPKQFANFFLSQKAKRIKVKPVLKINKRELAKLKTKKQSKLFKLSDIKVIQKLFMTPKVKPLKIAKVKTLEPIILDKESEVKEVKMEQLNLFSELEIKSIEVPKKNSTPKKNKTENKPETKESLKTNSKKSTNETKEGTKTTSKKKANNNTNNTKKKTSSDKKRENKNTTSQTSKNKNQKSPKVNNSKAKKQNKGKKSSKNKKKNKPKTNKK